MCRIASLFLLQRLKGSLSADARDFNNMETRTVIKFFFSPQGKAPNEVHAILTETLVEHTPSFATVKNWVAQFKRVDFFHVRCASSWTTLNSDHLSAPPRTALPLLLVVQSGQKHYAATERLRSKCFFPFKRVLQVNRLSINLIVALCIL